MEKTVLLKDVIPNSFELHPALNEMYLQLIYKDNLYSIEISLFNLFIYADTYEEILSQLEEDLEFLWENYACESDDNLSQDARVLASNLRNGMRKI